MWDTFSNRWHFKGILTTKTAIRVGAGSETHDPVSTDLPIVKDTRGKPYIPGSSLKGVVRSRLEQLVRTMEIPREQDEQSHRQVEWDGRSACDPLDHDRCCVTKDVVEAARNRNPNGWPREIYQRSCRICRLFGSQWIAGKVSIADLYPTSDTAVLSELRDGISIDRDKGTVSNKFDFEVVSVGSTFLFDAVGENLDSDTHEAGLLLLTFEELKTGMLRVGGFKSRGLGVVELRDFEVIEVAAPRKGDRQSIRSYVDYISGRSPEPLSKEAIENLLWSCVSNLAGDGEGGVTHA